MTSPDDASADRTNYATQPRLPTYRRGALLTSLALQIVALGLIFFGPPFAAATAIGGSIGLLGRRTFDLQRSR